MKVVIDIPDEMYKKFKKCDICGLEFELLAKNRYIVSNKPVFAQNTLYYEAFDCPFCGCQNIVNERMMCPIINKEDKL